MESEKEAVPPSRAETPGSAAQREAARAGRFQPGELVAGRYRIVALLGRGGMGEVYRADDLRLEQPVALKFLRAEIMADSAARARFLAEVKLARSVTHANVCRVHDLGEVDGLLYLSMEYVDGEDLSALLRRIGAPGEKKALEIAGQLCAGLAAAHAKGVLHRDLKPANVMIDGAGKVRITDFGLAILEEDERERGVVAGTPAYMAPEQLAGGEATAKSDIYALGLVLYELFTGVRAWPADDVVELMRLHATRSIEPPSAHGLRNERIERTILSCLERDLVRRPRSPTSVAAALTGADPIAAALAAGETPTPEMVAASGGEGTLSTTVALALVAAILALFVALMFVAPRASLYGDISLENEPAVLAHQAREILQSVGLAVPDGDRAFGFIPADSSFANAPGSMSWSYGVQFWYREAPFSLQPSDLNWFDWGVSSDDPPIHWEGMVSLWLSTGGELRWLEAVPPDLSWYLPKPARSGAHCNWEPLFAAAGLSSAEFKSVEPEMTPPQGCDERAAWVGPDPQHSRAELRVEGAAFEGRPVSFWLEGPVDFELGSLDTDLVWVVQFWLGLLALVGGIALARRNLTRGRGDPRAAARLALVVALTWLFVALLRTNHTTYVLVEQWLLVRALAWALFGGAFVGMLYLALEPSVRRVWPDHLVSWSRLISGRWRDPLVARDLLVGLGAGILGTLMSFTRVWPGDLLLRQAGHLTSNFPCAAGLRGVIAEFCLQTGIGVAHGFILLFTLVALRFLVRRSWIAYVLFAPLVLFANGFVGTMGPPILDWAVRLLLAALLLVVVARFGFFALAVTLATFYFLSLIPLTNELSVWYADATIFAGLVIGVLTFTAAHFARARTARAA